MIMMVMMLVLKLLNITLQGIDTLDGFKKLTSVKLVPRSGNDNGFRILFTEKLKCLCDPVLAHATRVAHNDSGCILNLIVVEFTEILHIHLAL